LPSFCDDEASRSRRFITLMLALGIALATCFKLKRKEGISLEA
jgi:hypothetical protein